MHARTHAPDPPSTTHEVARMPEDLPDSAAGKCGGSDMDMCIQFGEEGPDGKEALRDARSERALAATMLVCASECKSESKSKSEGSRGGMGGTRGCGVCLTGGKLRVPHLRVQVNIPTSVLAESSAHEIVSKTHSHPR
jgi:hypothetical protein